MVATLPLEKLNLAPQYPAEGYDYFWQPPDWVITDPTQHIIEGYASLPNLDDQGDIIPLDVIDAALPRFMKWANLREMHDKSAAGKVLKATVDEHGLRIQARVDDPTAWAKVKSGVYQGFSVGGDIPEDATEQRADGARIIKEVMLNEISLVDRPANPKARISVVKFEKHFTGKVHSHEACSESEAQRRWAFGVEGKDWAREHHFDNPGKLPARKMNAKCTAHEKENCEECGCDRTVGHPDGTGHSSGMAEKPESVHKQDEEACKIAERSDISPSEGESKYGNVTYADAKNKKYPIDTPAHVRAALSYWGMPKNRAKYSSADQATIGGKIHAAARRLGIGSNTKEKSMFDLLNKAIAVEVDPEKIKTLEAAGELIAKASGGEWHSQRDVSNPKSEAEASVDLEDNEAGDEDPVEDIMKAEVNEGDEGEGDGPGRSEDDAQSGPMGHLNKCHSSLQACHKAFGSEDHPAKAHCQAAIGHLNKAKKCFGAKKSAETGDLSKVLGTDPNLENRLAEIEENINLIAAKLGNTSAYFAKVLQGLPRSRPVPPEVQNRDDESGHKFRDARLALNGNR